MLGLPDLDLSRLFRGGLSVDVYSQRREAVGWAFDGQEIACAGEVAKLKMAEGGEGRCMVVAVRC